MPFVVPQVCRYTINATYGARPVANIVDMQIDTTGSIVERATACSDVAGDILNNWDDHIRPNLHTTYVAQSVSWVDLNSADGSVGIRSSTSANTWPAAGTQGGDPMPGNVAVLVRKNTVSRRGAKKGRMYIVGMNEGAIVGNNLIALSLNGLQTNFNNFWSGIEDLTVTPSRKPVVVHILTRGPEVDGKPGPPLTGDYTDLESFSVQSLLATQRRRLRK